MLFQARKRTESHRRVKDALLRGSSIYDALCAAGYSPKQARKGRAAIPDAVFELMTREELLAYECLGKKLLRDKRKLECCVVGFIYSNMMLGRNDGVKAARLLGEHCGVLKLTEEAHMQDKPLLILVPRTSIPI
ncbi:MAG: hypothetical protein DMG65_07180 [Candidatus Angelobacter sp. Gp1-AA117]|nr:MAG: hypothetical protein DMG65_07180 [Candidatus Angelobacter sp. Gp1-AA117]